MFTIYLCIGPMQIVLKGLLCHSLTTKYVERPLKQEPRLKEYRGRNSSNQSCAFGFLSFTISPKPYSNDRGPYMNYAEHWEVCLRDCPLFEFRNLRVGVGI